MLAKAEPDHDAHELHSSDAIAEALALHGGVTRSGAAYYFRYLEPELPPPAATSVLDLIANGAIEALGQGFVLDPAA